MTLGPLLAKFDVLLDSVAMRQVRLRVFEQWVELEAHVAVVTPRLVPDGLENFLCAADEFVGHVPCNLAIVHAFAHRLVEFVVEAASLNEVGNDDGIRRRPTGAELSVAANEVRIDRVEPQLGAAGDE